MAESNIGPSPIPTPHVVRELFRVRVQEVLVKIMEEELDDVLGARRYSRSEERRGYRNGKVKRTITTENGPTTLSIPRGRVVDEDGQSREFHSEVLPRYARRTRKVDEAILGVYLAGANSRRIRKALMPLLGEDHLSKSAISRVVGRLKDLFLEWSRRDLSDESYPILILDAIHLKVRLARRVVSAPVLVVLGADDAGNKRLVALRLAVSEASANWGELVQDLLTRGLPSPRILISDGHKGLIRALSGWPEAAVQRCTVHKRENLKKCCPSHAQSELSRDYNAIVDATSGEKAREAYDKFLAKWKRLCPPVARSLEEAGLRLLTFYQFPKPMWVSIRSTNAIENVNREFRRRTKTQGSFPTEDAAITLLYGLVAFDQLRMRKINGHQHVAEIANRRSRDAA